MARAVVRPTIVAMETTVHEIADGVYRLSTYLPEIAPAGFTINQFLLTPTSRCCSTAACAGCSRSCPRPCPGCVPVERLRWITFGHVEADECGAMNQWLAVAPSAEVAHGALGCAISIVDMADRPPRVLADGEVLDLGGKGGNIDTPHVPHGWDAGGAVDETTATLLCGDLFTQVGGEGPELVHHADIVNPAIQAEDMFRVTCLTSSTAPTVRSLADLAPRTLALMHGPSFAGDCAGCAARPRRRLRRATHHDCRTQRRV